MAEGACFPHGGQKTNKQKKNKRVGGVAQVVEHLLNKREALHEKMLTISR
jgi:dihydroxyacid dehydratase/phosphogluconate dehydratase